MKVAVVTDSNSGITQKMGEQWGVYVLPMPFIADSKTYLEDVELNHARFYELMDQGADISTSQPSLESVTALWDKLLTEYDEIVHIPMSSSLSGSCETAMMLARDYDGRVQVVDNLRISVTQLRSTLDAKTLADRGSTALEIKEKLTAMTKESVIYIMVDTLKYLKKGGRITPAAAALGTLLRIKPVLVIDGGKLDAFSKARTLKQAKTTMITAIQKDLEQRFHDPRGRDFYLEIAFTKDREAALEFRDELSGIFPEHEIMVAELSLSIACHIGPGALALACVKKTVN